MLTAELDYELPRERIAQEPLAQRDASKLLHVRDDGVLEDRLFSELPLLLRPGDVVVVNDTRVRRARLRGYTERGELELLVLHANSDGTHTCLTRPARRARDGSCVRIDDRLTATVLGAVPDHPGARRVRFATSVGMVDEAIERSGAAPLPPYIREPTADATRYQTVYAAGEPLSAAAPTAGLHFTPPVIAELRARGIRWTSVQLEVGIGTFVPIRARTLDAHRMHEERCTVPADAAEAIQSARQAGGRVIAVGTTVVRTLEARAANDGTLEEGSCATSLFIRPGHRFRAVDGLLTNFHQPRSSLLALLAAFIGGEAWRTAYEHALRGQYRFLSFGDCMLCWRPGE